MSSDPKPPSDRTSASEGADVDDVDRRLLAVLSDNPRLSKSAIARRLGVSTPTVSSRVARLERLGVIRGYRVDLDPVALGFPVSAWVRVRPGPGQLLKIAALAERTAQISECHRITGDDCFLLHAHAASLPELERLLDGFLLHGQTSSAITVSSPVPPRTLPIDGNQTSHQ